MKQFFPELDTYYIDPARHVTTTDIGSTVDHLDHLDRDVSDGVKCFRPIDPLKSVFCKAFVENGAMEYTIETDSLKRSRRICLALRVNGCLTLLSFFNHAH